MPPGGVDKFQLASCRRRSSSRFSNQGRAHDLSLGADRRTENRGRRPRAGWVLGVASPSHQLGDPAGSILSVESNQNVESKISFGQLILRKSIKTVATRCQILRLNAPKSKIRPRPAGGAYTALPRPPSWI